DMRLGFDGLSALVRSRLQADPLSGHLFIFRNRSADRLKILYWGGHGLCLWCQRLEAGRYHFPEAPAGANAVELSAGQLQMVRKRPANHVESCAMKASQPASRWAATARGDSAV